MTDLFTSKDKALKAIGKTLLCAVCVFVAGAINAPRVSAADMPQVPQLKAASADQPVPVDQQPLTVAPPLPPNIVLMLDDSGSMQDDYMPDSSSHQVPNPDKNGVYYNPAVTYLPPPKADGSDTYTSYTDITSVPRDGFNPDKNHEDLSDYKESFDYSRKDKKYEYVTKNYNEYEWHEYECKNEYDNKNGFGGYTYTHNSYCKFTYRDKEKKYYYYFKYEMGSGGSSVEYLVAPEGQGCGDYSKTTSPSCITADDTSGTSAPDGVRVGTNVANWFAYYHTRMLMAKSSLMNAFSGLNKDYRFGFSSIHNNGGFPEGVTTTTSSGHELAEVEPFGDGVDVNNPDQKRKFWDWIADAKPSGGTPLRQSLKAIGEYYSTSQPWEKSSTDNTMLACRQSYAILTTDGFWNGGSPSVDDADNKEGPEITGSDGKTYQYEPEAPFSGGYHDSGESDPYGSPTEENTLADVAMYYWNHDLADGKDDRPDIDNEVPVSGKADPAFWQHMTTFTIGMGFVPENIDPVSATAEKIFDWARGGDAIPGFSWPKPSAPDSGHDCDSSHGCQGYGGTIDNIADLLHAAVNGHGGFYSATSPQAFTKGLQDALKRIAARKGSGASLSASGATIGTDTYIYQVLYHTGDWSGSLYAYQLDANGNQADDPSWSAEAQMPEPDDRNIHTYNPDKSGSDADVAFEFDNLSDAEKTALGDDADAQKNMVQYLRGKLIDKDGWRARLTLGDIVDSQPIYVAAPDPDLYSDSRMDFAGSSNYKTFADNKKDVTPTLYVAANDGMLHGFDADTGKETYAYLPAAVILHGSETGDHSISQIADPDYGYQNSEVPHQYFNDGQLTVADVYMNGSWKVVLVGTTGRGHAKAVYALDVTDPDDVKLLWEKSAYTSDCDDCAYIGQMTSKPIIAQVADGQWAVLMGNGYNSEKNQAALLQFDLSDGTLHAHTTNTDTDNGLSGPAIWIADSTDNISTVAYAGDLYGRVWSFPLDTDGTSTPSTTGTVLFTAKDASGNVQPITSALAVQMDVDTGKRWVFFGTGKYLSADDVDDDSQQTWYGLIVNDADGNVVKATSRDNLVERKIVGEGTDSKGNKGRTISEASEVDPIGTKDGWFIDLKDTGERMVVANQFNGSLLYGTSIIPSNTDPCDPSGSGWVMAVDPFTGTNPDWDVFGSTLTSGNGDDQKTRNTSGTYFSSMPNAPIFLKGSEMNSPTHMYSSTSSGKVKDDPLKNREGAGKKSERISWREMVSD